MTSNILPVEDIEKRLVNKKKKVLLVDAQRPYNQTEQVKGYSFRADGDQTYTQPFGLARIAGYLNEQGIPVELVRLQDFTRDNASLERKIQEADIIGLSALTTIISNAFNFARKVKNEHPEKLIIGGGEHFGLDYEWILNNQATTGIDACCTMQGELPILSLSLGIDKERIGSLSFKGENGVQKNANFPRLDEHQHSRLLQPIAASLLPTSWTPMIFPEFKAEFNRMGCTQTGSGCLYDCDFCTNGAFYGRGYTSMLNTAKKEIENLREAGTDFFFVNDAMLNGNSEHLNRYLEFMKSKNQDNQKTYWGCFYAARSNPEQKRFKDLAEAGCIMIGVGLEDVIGDRSKLGKGASTVSATRFIDEAKEDLLVRTLMIMGLPNHYGYTRQEIKDTTLDYMKSHPQALYRINFWTPLVGTQIFNPNSSLLYKDPRENPEAFNEHNTLNSVIEPEKMYGSLGIPKEKRWVKDRNDWADLRNEIMQNYLLSREHSDFLETLKGKGRLGKTDMLYNIAKRFQALNLDYIGE